VTRNSALVLSVLLFFASVAVSIWAYPRMPAQVPSHFDAAGRIDGYLPKMIGVGLWPALIFALALLIPILPAISPQGFRLKQSAAVLNLTLLGVMVVEFIASIFVIRASLGKAAPPIGSSNLMIGILFVVIGNYMGKVRKNFFFGVRTPWTLASDEVWLRTNRLSGWLFVIGGITLAVLGFVNVDTASALTIVVSILVIVPVVYSLVVYKRIEGFTSNGSHDS
jgi:uncharacterized membrane protein